jgi:hypothetical protein
MFNNEPIYIWHQGLNVCWEGYFELDVSFNDIRQFFVCKSRIKESLYQNALSSMFEVEPILCVLSRNKRNVILNVLDRIKINNSLGRGKSHCMVHNTRNERQKIFDALEHVF